MAEHCEAFVHPSPMIPSYVPPLPPAPAVPALPPAPPLPAAPPLPVTGSHALPPAFLR